MVMMETAVLDDVLAAFNFHPVVTGAHDFQPLEMPATLISFQQERAIRVIIRHGGKIEDGVLVSESPKFDESACRARIGYRDGVAVGVGASAYSDDVQY